MNRLCYLFVLILFGFSSLGKGQAEFQFGVEQLQGRLREESPRLIWQEGDENLIRERVKNDRVARAFYGLVIGQANGILELPPLERVQTGRRILSVSRNALKRATCLAFAWRMTEEQRYLDRLEDLLVAVSGFSDWNPSHFLDVAEMSLAVSLALDWAGDDLDAETRSAAEQALLQHGLEAGASPEVASVFTARNNWNQVCNAGMVAAAIVLAEEAPELAAAAIERAVETLPIVLKTYAPDGVYVEGAMYWAYGTEFNVVLLDTLATAIGDDFGLAEAEGFRESADFVQLLQAPSGQYYNFYDSNLSSGFMGAQLWFAKTYAEPRYAPREALLEKSSAELDPGSMSGRLLPVELLWYVRYQPGRSQPLPLNWIGQGENPIGIFRSSFGDPDALYLAFKGGRGSNNHGNMDAGSFVLELNGVRWSVDPGNQSYHDLETYFTETGGSLWSTEQDSARWDLLTKNNFGHSTLTVDDQLHNASGMAEIVAFDAADRTATLDLSEALGPKVEAAQRRFSAPDDRTVVIEDRLQLAAGVDELRWQMVTQAEVATFSGGATLSQDGQRLKVEVLSPDGLQVSVTALSPPPHPMDKRMPGLKRIDLVVPAYLAEEDELRIEVRLTADHP